MVLMLIKSILALAALAAAFPTGVVENSVEPLGNLTSRDVSNEDLTKIKFYAQHAAAAYCNSAAAAGDAIVCDRNNIHGCPEVQQNRAIVVSSFSGELTGIGGYVAIDEVRREIVLAVRGSNNIRNFIADVLLVFRGCGLVHGCQVHTGFANSWDEIADVATRAVKSAREQHPDFLVVATGHSLGGAVATLGAAYLRQTGIGVDVFTYGSPRIGNDAWANWMTAQKGGQWRITHASDPVPRLPPLLAGYRHISPEYWLEDAGTDDDEKARDSIKICPGIANVRCNGRTLGLDIDAHLKYLGQEVSACGSSSIRWKRGAEVDDAELEHRLNEWSLKDQELFQDQLQ